MISLGSSLQGARLPHSIRSLAHLAESCSSSATPSVTCIASAQVRIPASSRPPLACLHERNFVFDRVIAHLTIGFPWPWQATSVCAQLEPERQQEGAFPRFLAWAATAFAAGAATAAWQLPTVRCDALQPTVRMEPFNITDILRNEAQCSETYSYTPRCGLIDYHQCKNTPSIVTVNLKVGCI